MDRKTIRSEIIDRHSGVFLALQHSDACTAVRDLLAVFSSDVTMQVALASNIPLADMDAFLFADEKLPALKLTLIMSNLNQRQIFDKVSTNELGSVPPERFVLHIAAMQEVNILNNMRALYAERNNTSSDSDA